MTTATTKTVCWKFQNDRGKYKRKKINSDSFTIGMLQNKLTGTAALIDNKNK